MNFLTKVIINGRHPLPEAQRGVSTAKGSLRKGDHALQKQKLIDFLCVDGIADNTRFKLTEESKRDLLSEMNLNTTEENIVGVSGPGDITQKTLFFNDSVGKQVDELKGFFEPERYQAIYERMKNSMASVRDFIKFIIQQQSIVYYVEISI